MVSGRYHDNSDPVCTLQTDTPQTLVTVVGEHEASFLPPSFLLALMEKRGLPFSDCLGGKEDEGK